MNLHVPEATARPTRGMTIQTVPVADGLSAWLVEEHAVPLVAVEIAFRGGTAQDPPGKEGLGAMLAGLLDEGAGDLDDVAFADALEARAIELSFSMGKDALTATLKTLLRHEEEAFRLLGLALRAARCDAPAIERVRAQMIAGLRQQKNDPGAVSSKDWFAAAFPNHPYGRPDRGTEESLAAITREDLLAHRDRLIARSAIVVSAVGAIDRARLATRLGAALNDLPASAMLVPVGPASVAGIGTIAVHEIDIPQSTIRFGTPGIGRTDPDLIPATVMNHILGGGSFTSRLWTEVRETRGLAYSVSSSIAAYDHGGAFIGGTATKNERAAEALDVIRTEIRRMATDGPTVEELDKAKRYLTGSYALRFDTSAKIAGQLTQVQLDRLDTGYIARRNALFAAVTMADVQRVAARILGEGQLLVTVAGRPQGL
jgi:zinc protease